MSKHLKTKLPSNTDLKRNPLIGGSRGTTMSGTTPDELEEAEGVNTIEGDLENATNAEGGLDKTSRLERRRPRGRG